MSKDRSGVIVGNDMDGYLMPTYDSPSYQENLAAYKAWRKLWAEKEFESAIGNVHKDSVVTGAEIIFELPYHPDFAEVFFACLVNRLDGCAPLSPDGVENFLEGMYGTSLERPDCDHLLAAIQKHGRYPVQAPENVHRAIHWLEATQCELPIWPPQYGEPDEHGKTKRLYAVNLATLNAGQLPNESEARVPPR